MSIAEPKRYKQKSAYYWKTALIVILLSLDVFLIVDSFVTPEQEYVDWILSRELIGSGRQSSNIMIEKYIVSNFGKTGIQIVFVITALFAIITLYKIVCEYRRLVFCERQIREGLRAPDDYVDDYVRVPLWKKVANLFTKKRKKKYPSEREMRDSLKKNKYYKE
ncbi:MAG: hypothetical protein IKP62_12610 [Salinivirgaceae bacterium]|nr:hypothetical protein [Salinivirgaceae bacterium]